MPEFDISDPAVSVPAFVCAVADVSRKPPLASAEFGIVPAAIFAPLIVGATENVVAARLVVPTTVSPAFAFKSAPLTLSPAGNVYANVPPNDACARLVGFICDAKMPFAPMFVLSTALPHD